MEYDNTHVRRQDRLLEEPRARELLRGGEYGVLPLVGESGGAYGIPLNFVWDGCDALYIYCAPEGEILRSIRSCPEVSFCVVGRTRVVPDKFTTNYESVVLRAHAHADLPREERMKALGLLLEKYCPDDMTVGGGAIRREILFPHADHPAGHPFASGKCKRVR